MNSYYSIKEAARLLGISRAYVYYLKDTGQISVEKIGAQYVIHKDELERYKNNKGVVVQQHQEEKWVTELNALFAVHQLPNHIL